MDGAADFQSRDAARDHVFPEQVVIGAIGGAISYNSAQARTKFPARAREPNAFIVDIGRFFEPARRAVQIVTGRMAVSKRIIIRSTHRCSTAVDMTLRRSANEVIIALQPPVPRDGKDPPR